MYAPGCYIASLHHLHIIAAKPPKSGDDQVSYRSQVVTVSADLQNMWSLCMYVWKDKLLSTLLQYIWSEQISCIILLSQGHCTSVVHTLQHKCSNLQFLCFVKLVKTLEYPAFFICKPEGSYDRPEETPETSSSVNLALTWQPVSLSVWQELDASLWAPLITIQSSLWLLCHSMWYYSYISPLNRLLQPLSFNWQQHERRFSDCTRA